MSSMTTGILAIVVIIFTFSFPESPRWLALKGRMDEARDVIALVDDVDPDSEHANFILASITSVNDHSAEAASMTSLFKYGKEKMVYRLALAAATQMFSQASGSALITYYSEQLFTTVGLSHDMSKVLGASDLTFKLVCCMIPFFTIERAGRRKLLIIAASGMSTCMVSMLLEMIDPHADYGSVLSCYLWISSHRRQPRSRIRRNRLCLPLRAVLPHRLPRCQLLVLARGHHNAISSASFGYLDRCALADCVCCCP
jgi:hypothetical protein